MNKHEARSAATRAELIMLGIERIPIRGYAATSIRDIVAGSGQTKGAFEYHFPSKAEFFMTLVEALTGAPGTWAALARANPAETLEGAVERIIAASGAAQGWGRWILATGDFARTDGTAPEYRARLDRLYGYWLGEIAAWVSVLSEQGLVRTDLAVELLAEMAFGTIEGHIVHAAIYGRGAEVAARAVARVLSR